MSTAQVVKSNARGEAERIAEFRNTAEAHAFIATLTPAERDRVAVQIVRRRGGEVLRFSIRGN